MPVKINLVGQSNRFIAANPKLKTNIDVALKEISDNPFVDAETKFYYPVPPCMISLYKKDSLWVLYRLDDVCTQVYIWNIGAIGHKVSF
jgi:hypothetical protein